MGSASEVEYHLLLAHDLQFISSKDYQALSGNVAEVKRMLFSFLDKLRKGGKQSGISSGVKTTR